MRYEVFVFRLSRPRPEVSGRACEGGCIRVGTVIYKRRRATTRAVDYECEEEKGGKDSG